MKIVGRKNLILFPGRSVGSISLDSFLALFASLRGKIFSYLGATSNTGAGVPDKKLTLGVLTVFLRFALAASYLSSVTSRFGFWGEDTGWGNYAAFLEYTAKVNPYLPLSVIPTLARVVDVAEIAIALLLILGFRIRETAFLSGVMLFLFAFGMNLGVGVISTLDHSVYTACVASFLLAVLNDDTFSLDALLSVPPAVAGGPAKI
jgi:thiosulfate dehydrogenase [quinone] large subunit